jgi:hypothetical protein
VISVGSPDARLTALTEADRSGVSRRHSAPASRQPLLVKSQQSITNTIGVRVTRGMASVSPAFKTS